MSKWWVVQTKGGHYVNGPYTRAKAEEEVVRFTDPNIGWAMEIMTDEEKKRFIREQYIKVLEQTS
jgi:hypothetical protein